MSGQLSGSTTMSGPAASPGRGSWLVLGLLSTAQFMLILDITVVNVALPDLSGDLGLSRVETTWVVTAYTMVFGALLLLGGRIADLFGARRTALVGLAVFTAATAVAGTASTGEALLAGRAAQGVGAALLSPAALSIVTTLFADRRRARALAVWGALGGLGSAVGVLLGGVLAAGPGWRWIFFLNLPVGVVVLLLLPALVAAGAPSRQAGGLDIIGAVTVTLGTAALVYGLISSGEHGWISAATLLPLAAAGVLYAAFPLVERSVRRPLVDLLVLRARPLVAGSILMLVATGLLVGGFFLGSFALQHVHGLTALRTGLLFLPVAVTTVVGAHLGSRALGAFGPRPTALGGLVLAAGGAAIASRSGVGWLVTGLAVLAIGVGACFVTALSTALARVETDRAGLTSGVVNSFHEIGGAVGVAVASSIAAAGITGSLAAGFGSAFLVDAAAALGAAVLMAWLIPGGRLVAASVPLAH